MTIKLKNITQLFRNVRTRMILLSTIAVLVVGVVIGVKRLLHKEAPVSDVSVQLKEAPTIESVPGGLTQSPSADYKRLQTQQNIQQAQVAARTGQSAIPTLLDTSDFRNQTSGGIGAGGMPCYQPCNPCCQQSVSSNVSSQNTLQPSQLRAGTLIYDTHGKVIGRLGADGKVRDENGKVIGTVGPDGLVRDLNGQTVIGSAAAPAAGDAVYDAAGRVIGHVGVDGKVRDAQGYVIGTVGPDGIVHNLKGGILGRVASPKSSTHSIQGTPVFDAKNRLLGRADAQGQLRDSEGKNLGTLDAEGIVRDKQGHIIGKTGVSQAGAPVYDKKGQLLGTVDANGQVVTAGGRAIEVPSGTIRRAGTPFYDAQGHLLGTSNQQGEVEDAQGQSLGQSSQEGILRDKEGNVLGKTGVPQVGAPVYDAQGRLIGRVLPNGDVVDASGKKIGHVNADGVVKAADGRILGRAYLRNGAVAGQLTRNPVPGSPVYDEQGHLIGTVGADGKVRNDQGEVLGTLDSNGTLYGPHHELLGKVGAASPGVPVYDRQGHLIGTAGEQGIIRNSQGQRIASVDAAGNVRNRQGQIIGSITPPSSSKIAASPTNNPADDVLNNALPQGNAVRLEPDESKQTNPQLQAILERQQQQLSAQKAEQLKQQMQAAMSTQAAQLFAAWTSPLQQYVAGMPPESNLAATGRGGLNNNTDLDSPSAPAAVKAGSIMYAVLLTAVNTDEPGPVLAKIVEGKFKGARLIGTLSNQGQRVLLSFNTMTLPNVSQSIPINTVAIDSNTARTALSSRTDNHYWLRYGTLFASAFIQGYGQSFLTYGNSLFNFNNKPIDYSPTQRMYIGLGQVGTQYASALGRVFNTPPTVHVYSGTPIGILFVADLPALPEK
jgi:intracellular multiplication protein IcmE